ncbi:AAA family ATPase [Streptomyces sp. NBC_01717]|uniref:AAA family ATPase n=1 Tax=Streptomyces sp. NBC_01717 TaxID=2975918 RepID=UPI002E36807E|nr:AAA family ATPase [Streptomyces sp. NBC_01717]
MENVRHLEPRDQADPHGQMRDDMEAELDVIGGCLHNPRHIPSVRTILQGGDFARPAHELIWNALGHLYDTGAPITPVALRIELESRKQLTRAGGLAYLVQVGDHTGGGEPAYFAEKVRAASDLRAEADLGRRIVQQATAPDAEPGTAVTFIDDYLQRQKERAAGRSGDPADALLAELLDASSLDNMPTLEPLVGDLLHLDTLARIIGPSGHMKSFVTIDLAGHVGTGMKWHGHHVRQGTVVYLVAEGARGIRQRVRAWEKHYGQKMHGVLFLPRPVQARGPEWDTLIEAMRRLQPAMIVIDTQARVSVGVEENSNTELGIVIERMDDLRRATEACVLLIHHTGHVGEHGRGASAAKGALQSEMHVSKKGDNAKNIVVTMKVGKQKDSEEGADLQFGLKVVTLDGEHKPDGRPVTSVVLESLDQRPDVPAIGTPEWLVRRLDTDRVDMRWGGPRVIEWCRSRGIQMRKDKIEEAIRIRKRRGSFEELQDARNDLPPDLPPSTFNQTPPDLGGTPGEFDENPRSNIPPQTGGGQGDGPSKPPSPRSPSREGGGVGEDEKNTTPDTPLCTICDTELQPLRAERGYTTHLGCDPETGSHPNTAA